MGAVGDACVVGLQAALRLLRRSSAPALDAVVGRPRHGIHAPGDHRKRVADEEALERQRRVRSHDASTSRKQGRSTGRPRPARACKRDRAISADANVTPGARGRRQHHALWCDDPPRPDGGAVAQLQHAFERLRIASPRDECRIARAAPEVVQLAEGSLARRDPILACADFGDVDQRLRLLLLQPLPISRWLAVGVINGVRLKVVAGHAVVCDEE